MFALAKSSTRKLIKQFVTIPHISLFFITKDLQKMMWINLSTLISNLYLKLLYATKYVSLTFKAYQFRDELRLFKFDIKNWTLTEYFELTIEFNGSNNTYHF